MNAKKKPAETARERRKVNGGALSTSECTSKDFYKLPYSQSHSTRPVAPLQLAPAPSHSLFTLRVQFITGSRQLLAIFTLRLVNVDHGKFKVGRTSQLSGITADFSGDCDGFYDGFFGQEGRILRRILWRIFCLVFSLGKRRIL